MFIISKKLIIFFNFRSIRNINIFSQIIFYIIIVNYTEDIFNVELSTKYDKNTIYIGNTDNFQFDYNLYIII